MLLDSSSLMYWRFGNGSVTFFVVAMPKSAYLPNFGKKISVYVYVLRRIVSPTNV
jgi:hypothetical protein